MLEALCNVEIKFIILFLVQIVDKKYLFAIVEKKLLCNSLSFLVINFVSPLLLLLTVPIIEIFFLEAK